MVFFVLFFNKCSVAQPLLLYCHAAHLTLASVPLQTPPVLRTLGFEHAVSQRLPDDEDELFAAARSPFASASAFLSASPSSSTTSSSSRLVIVAPGSTVSGIACFVQTTATPNPNADANAATDSERRTLVLVVPSFSLRPNSAEYTEFFSGSCACEREPAISQSYCGTDHAAIFPRIVRYNNRVEYGRLVF